MARFTDPLPETQAQTMVSEMRPTAAPISAHARQFLGNASPDLDEAPLRMEPRRLSLAEEDALTFMFARHPPDQEQTNAMERVYVAACEFARVVLENCPRSADRSAAVRQIRDACMTANAAIALRGASLT